MISLKIIFCNLINYLYSPQKKPSSSPARLFLHPLYHPFYPLSENQSNTFAILTGVR